MTIHLPDTFDPSRMGGTMCGLRFGLDVPDYCVITDWEEWRDVDCDVCTLMPIPHPQPVTLRVHELAREAGRPKSQPVIDMLLAIGHHVKAPSSKVELLGFEHEALVAALR